MRCQTFPHPPQVAGQSCQGPALVPDPGIGPGLPHLLGAQRPKEHDLAALHSSGYLERLGFDYRPATPSLTFRHPSSLGLKP